MNKKRQFRPRYGNNSYQKKVQGQKFHYWNPKTKAVAAKKWLADNPATFLTSIKIPIPRRKFWRVYATLRKTQVHMLKKMRASEGKIATRLFAYRNWAVRSSTLRSFSALKLLWLLKIKLNYDKSPVNFRKLTYKSRRKGCFKRLFNILSLVPQLKRFILLQFQAASFNHKFLRGTGSFYNFFSANIVSIYHLSFSRAAYNLKFVKRFVYEVNKVNEVFIKMRHVLVVALRSFFVGIRLQSSSLQCLVHVLKFLDLICPALVTGQKPVFFPGAKRHKIIKKRLKRRKKYFIKKLTRRYHRHYKIRRRIPVWRRKLFGMRQLYYFFPTRKKVAARRSRRSMHHRYRKTMNQQRRKFFKRRLVRFVFGARNFIFTKKRFPYTTQQFFFCHVTTVKTSCVFDEMEVIIFSLFSDVVFTVPFDANFHAIKPEPSALWYRNPWFYFGLDLFIFKLYKLYLTNLQSQVSSFVYSPVATNGLQKKINKYYVSLLKSYVKVLKTFYRLVFVRKVAKNLASSSVVKLISRFYALTGQFKFMRVFDWEIKPEWQVRNTPAKKIMQNKEGLFKLKLLFDRLFVWLYNRKNIRFVFGSLVKKGHLISYSSRFQILYKKNITITLPY